MLLFVCQTKLNKRNIIDLILLKKYSLKFVNSKTRSGGLLIYIKNSILYSIRQDLKFNCSKYNTLWLEYL